MRPPANRPELTWLGQCGFVLRAAGTTALIDPFVSEHELRLFGPPETALVTADVDWLLVTHEHLDHLDIDFLSVLAAGSPNVRIVVPSPVAALIEAVPGDRVVGVQPGGTVDFGPLRVTVVPAFHALRPADGYSDGRTALDDRARFVGYVVEAGDTCVYHSGDTIVTPELESALVGRRIDVALLPVNGRDYYREQLGIAGNMSAREAAELGVRIGARLLVPMHWDLIRGNTVPAGALADAVSELGCPVHVLNMARYQPLAL